MKVPEVRLTSYCSFCASYKRTEAEDVCYVCGDDVCYSHASTLGVWREGIVGRLRSMGRKPTPNLMTLKLVPICPSCAREGTLFSVMRKVIARGLEGAEGRNTGGNLG
ncbi:MAG: hypothetical protein ABSB56_02940 [Nitrososphaerales archaeon]|jgi:hypothetical protein